jgi:hypothetical protein
MLRMPSKREELERMDVNILAVFCQKVAEAHTDNSLEAHHARQLKYEWTLLADPPTPPSRLLKTQEDIETHAEELRGRMVNFLSGVLPLD